MLGLGVGSHEGEYAAAGVDFHHRGRELDRGIAEMRWAWEEPATTPYRQDPRPPRIPLWIGGASGAARRRAASHGDGWIPLFLPPEEYGTALRRLREETEAAGRSPDAVEAAVVVFVHVGPHEVAQERGSAWLSDLYGIPPKSFARHLVAGDAANCAAAIARYQEAGARHVAVMVADDEPLAHFSALAEVFELVGPTARKPESRSKRWAPGDGAGQVHHAEVRA